MGVDGAIICDTGGSPGQASRALLGGAVVARGLAGPLSPLLEVLRDACQQMGDCDEGRAERLQVCLCVCHTNIPTPNQAEELLRGAPDDRAASVLWGDEDQSSGSDTTVIPRWAL